jgi:hypothetical protein
MDNEQLQKDVMVTLRQVEILKAQAELAHFYLTELARQVGIRMIDPSQTPQPAPPKPAAPKV